VPAHELAHVVQQTGRAGTFSSGERAEREAAGAARSVLAGGRGVISSRVDGPIIQTLDLGAADLAAADEPDPRAARLDPAYIDYGIEEMRLLEEWKGLGVRFTDVAVRYKDGRY
jgi:hypothetical protein